MVVATLLDEDVQFCSFDISRKPARILAPLPTPPEHINLLRGDVVFS
jgi:hypothetical protein